MFTSHTVTINDEESVITSTSTNVVTTSSQYHCEND